MSLGVENEIARRAVAAAKRLRDSVGRLRFAPPVAHVYNPLDYAWAAHEKYLLRYANGPKPVIFLGMNPGPFGMMQTGVPFGEITAVRDWLGIVAPVHQPKISHRKRPIAGFDCARSEISGQRLWNLFARRFGTATEFFADHFVLNYCPLAFLEASGCNRTPDKLPTTERAKLFAICDLHLREVVAALQPKFLIGIGQFAAKRAQEIFTDNGLEVASIPHPSPANPAANRGWSTLAANTLEQVGVWKKNGR